jgi:putative ABC transport system permease protein
VPGMLAVSGTTDTPFPTTCCSNSVSFERNGEVVRRTPWVRRMRSNFLEVMGVPLLQGRMLSESDAANPPVPVVVSKSLAEMNWPGESALGRQMSWNHRNDLIVVGVVGDIRHRSLHGDGEPTLYVPVAYSPLERMSIVFPTAGGSHAALEDVQAAIRSVSPDIPIGDPNTLVNLIRETEADGWFRAILIWIFAGAATVLASVGIFGVTAQVVLARAREIGIRTALGAQVPGLVRLVVRDGLRSVAVGTLVGLGTAWWVTRLIGHLLYGIDARDPLTYGGVAVLAFMVFVVAAYIPARRVSRIEPMVVMSQE